MSSNASENGATRRGVFLCVYRSRNAARVAKLVTMAKGLSLSVALWALDESSPELGVDTVGQGPGQRIELLNRLWHAGRGEEADVVVVSDDDIAFVRGDMATLLDTVERADFHFAQPAHAAGSHISHGITRRRSWSVARRTDFVEIGPIHVVRRPWIRQVFPMPGDFGMGYGLDLVWQGLARHGCRMGVIDSVTIRHPPPASDTYDSGPEMARLEALLAERGLDEMWHGQHVLATWRPWRSRAPWRTAGRP